MAERYCIGVECVGLRHSTAVLATADGCIRAVARIDHGISLHTTPRRDLRTYLHDLLIAVVNRSGLDRRAFRQSTICIGLTGVTFPYDALVELPDEVGQLKLECPQVICTGDAEIVFAGLVRGDTGTAVLCHMGSTAYVISGSKRQRFGGWGPVIGDEGSGYAMGRAALRAIGAEHDRREPPSILWQEVREWLERPGIGAEPALPDWLDAAYRWQELREKLGPCGLDEVALRSVLFAFSHATARESGISAWRSVASSLTIPLFRAYSKNDPQARDIVERAAEHLAGQHYDACRAAGVLPTCGPLVLYGGVLTHHPPFIELLGQKLAERWPEVELPKPVTAHMLGTQRPACGALLFALADSTSDNLRLPSMEIVDRLAQQHGAPLKWSELRND